MTTASEAFASLRTRLSDNAPSELSFIVYQNEDPASLPDTPSPFAYAEFVIDPSRSPVAFGGGVGANLYRNRGRLVVYVFVPRGSGISSATDIAESIASLFRSFRNSVVSCQGASVVPGGDGENLRPHGIQSEISNYYWSAVEINFFFDQVG